jgi:hypothetical protein
MNKNLHKYFLNNNGKIIHKWLHYFDVYEKYFHRFLDKKILIFEIGVFKGGSLEMWKNYFSPDSTIVGIDINPDCKIYESDNVFVEIGNQSDFEFLQSLIDKYGKPDIVLDDGSHVMNDLIKTFDFLYYNMKENGIYLAEDMHTCYWDEYGGGLLNENTFIEFSKSKIDELNSYHTRGRINPTEFTKSTDCISFYDSIIVFEKRPQPKKRHIQTGGVDFINDIEV